MKELIKQILVIVLGLGLAMPLYAVEIINNVSSSASTGSINSPQAGQVVEGESKASVKIYTEVDGEVVTNIDEIITAPAGEDAVIEKSIEVNLPSVYSSTTVKAEAKAPSLLFAFLNKIFNYVISIFKFS